MAKNNTEDKWLPTSLDEMRALGWEQADIILFSGDAYVDHPAFGIAIIARVLEAEGFKVAVVPQPNWRDDLRDFKKMGIPRLFFGVSSGNMDSMVNHYTARKRLRSNDAYSAGGKSNFRPDYATQVYSNILKKLYPNTPLIIGGIEASLRRFTHYDYWSNSLMPSILESSKADILVYGMGEKAICNIAKGLNAGKTINELQNIAQIVYKSKNTATEDTSILPSFEECKSDKKNFAEHFLKLEKNSNKIIPEYIAEKDHDNFIIANPPDPLLNDKSIDQTYQLAYTRLPHPRYRKKQAIPAYEMIKHSVTIHRGCFGACSFCTISMHQGRFIQSRSETSILKEIEQIKKMPDFYGSISDLGGPSANMYKMHVIDVEKCKKCNRPSCLYPSLCKNINASHKDLNDLYAKVSNTKDIKNVFITSGLRYDLFLNENTYINDGEKYFKNLVRKHISGRLKVAPESSNDNVLKLMRKPSYKLFRKLKNEYNKINRQNGKRQEIIPYIITGHPGNTIENTFEMAFSLKSDGLYPEQIQDFTPTPMTLSSTIFYLGFNPYNREKINTALSMDDKKIQNQILLWHKKEAREYLLKNLRHKHFKNKLVELLKR